MGITRAGCPERQSAKIRLDYLRSAKGDNILAKFEKQVSGDFQTIVGQLDSDIRQSGLSMELVDESNFRNGNVQVAIRVYDKYFMRNGNRASLSVTIVASGNIIFISAIGAGGGKGVIFNFSLGAESELTDIVAESISQMGL